MTEDTTKELFNIDLVVEIVAAYVANNHVALNDLPALIFNVHSSIAALHFGGGTGHAEPDPARLTSAQIRRSVTPDALISFIDGAAYKTLKRHLTKHGLTPEAYRTQYGLPSDYPMVAASYSEKRSGLAKAFGLGERPGRASQNDVDKPSRTVRKTRT